MPTSPGALGWERIPGASGATEEGKVPLPPTVVAPTGRGGAISPVLVKQVDILHVEGQQVRQQNPGWFEVLHRVARQSR